MLVTFEQIKVGDEIVDPNHEDLRTPSYLKVIKIQGYREINGIMCPIFLLSKKKADGTELTYVHHTESRTHLYQKRDVD